MKRLLPASLAILIGATCALQPTAARADFHGDTFVQYHWDNRPNQVETHEYQSTVYGTGANFLVDVVMAVADIAALVADFLSAGATSEAKGLLSTAMQYGSYAKNCADAARGDASGMAHCLAKG